jgi:hypothetical protein
VKQSRTFVATAVGLVVAGILVAWPLGDDGVRRAVLGAGILALGTQLPLHFLLKSWKDRNDRFLVAVVVGFVVRVLVIGLGVLLYVVSGRVEPLPFILSLGGFLIAVVFAEAFFAHRRLSTATTPAES